MYRIIIAATVFIGAFHAHALGQEKKTKQDEAANKVIDVIHAIKKKTESAPRVVGEQSVHEFVLISKICDPKNTFDDVLKYAKKLSEGTTDKETKKILSRYIAALETMARMRKERENEKNEIKKLIYSLRDQREFEFYTTDDPKSPAAKLLAIGKEAIPYLIDELENDELTRSVSPEISTNRKIIRLMYVLRIGDCVCGILEEITGKSFGDSWYIHDSQKAKMSPRQVREEAKKWWEKKKQRPRHPPNAFESTTWLQCPLDRLYPLDRLRQAHKWLDAEQVE